jgi:hypothetical protein
LIRPLANKNVRENKLQKSNFMPLKLIQGLFLWHKSGNDVGDKQDQRLETKDKSTESSEIAKRITLTSKKNSESELSFPTLRTFQPINY